MRTLKKVLKTLVGIVAAMILVPILLVALVFYENYENPTDDREQKGEWR